MGKTLTRLTVIERVYRIADLVRGQRRERLPAAVPLLPQDLCSIKVLSSTPLSAVCYLVWTEQSF